MLLSFHRQLFEPMVVFSSFFMNFEKYYRGKYKLNLLLFLYLKNQTIGPGSGVNI